MAIDATPVRDATPHPTDLRTVRCENERCRHIIFKFRRDALVAGSIVIEVKCRCKTMNKIRIGATVS